MSTTQGTHRSRARNIMALAVGSALLGGVGLGAAGAQDLPGSVSITGSVFDDQDGNGLFGNDENGLAGVVVELRDLNGTLVAVTVTSFNGFYSFTDLEPGTYTVSESSNPSGFPEDTTSSSFVVDAVQPLSGIDFGNAAADAGGGLPGSVQAQVFADQDGDGVLDFNEGDRIAGAQVRILDVDGQVLAELSTDSMGVASWTAPEGTTDVLVDVQLPAGLQATTPLFTPVRLESDQTQTIAIGAVDPDDPPLEEDPTTDTTLPDDTTTTEPPGDSTPPPDDGSTDTPTTTPAPPSTVAAPAAPAAPAAGAVALPVAPASSLTTSSNTGATVVLGERASAGSSAQDTTLRRVLAATGRDSSKTARQGAALMAVGAALAGAGSLLRRTPKPATAPAGEEPANSGS